MKTLVRAYETANKRTRAELYHDQYGYTYKGEGCSGSLGHMSEADAFAYFDRLAASGHFHGGKTPMRLVPLS